MVVCIEVIMVSMRLACFVTMSALLVAAADEPTKKKSAKGGLLQLRNEVGCRLVILSEFNCKIND